MEVKKFVTLLLCAVMSLPVCAKEKLTYGVFNHLGCQMGVGTEGFSLGVGSTLSPFFEVGLGYNIMPAFSIGGNLKLVNGLQASSAATGSVSQLNTVRVKGELDRITFDAKLYFYPFGSAANLFVVGGVSFGGGRLAKISGHSEDVKAWYEQYGQEYGGTIEAVLGKSALKVTRTGDLEAEVRVKKVRPYIGAGFGRFVPKRSIGLRVEAGVQFTGKLKLFQDGNQLEYEDLLKGALQEWSGNDRLSKLVDKMKIYPVLKLSVTCRLL